MATATKVQPVKKEDDGWQMQLRQQAQSATQRWRDNNAPQADNGWGNTQARVDPFNQQATIGNVTNQMQGVLGQISPFLNQQRQQQNADLYEANNKAVNNALTFRGVDQTNSLQLLAAKPAAEYNAQVNYENSTAGYNARQNQQYAVAKQANSQYAAAAESASAQRDSAASQAAAQKYVADRAAQANITGALFGAVGNIASGFGGGRYW